MSLQNLATIFGPTLLGPSEKDSKIAHSSQPIILYDNWYLDEVRCQVKIGVKDEVMIVTAASMWV